MNSWTKYPQIYEINTWVWLEELSRSAGRPVTLASVPDIEWDSIAALGFDAVWLMGVWERSPMGRTIAMADESLRADFQAALPDFKEADHVGSPYCIRRYRVDEHLGGPDALAVARAGMAARGLRLILDFVPNHVAPDHPWLAEHPTYFIRGGDKDLSRDPASFIDIGGNIFACAKDPCFPAWADRVQLNGFHSGLRAAAVETLNAVAAQCDGVRCDMAMLLLDSVFEETWGPRAGDRPATEYWGEVIPAVKKAHPGFLFIAEAYWDKEWELQQQGFDFCYDKRLYDRLAHEPAESVRLHLRADRAYQDKLVRFIENHGEARAAAAFNPERQRAAAVAALTLPGARLIHEGQLEGLRVRLPVSLGRRPEEAPATDSLAFYLQLLCALNEGDFMQGDWQLCECGGWPDNATCNNLVAWTWATENSRCLIVVNLSETQSQGLVKIAWPGLNDGVWRLNDIFQSTSFERDGAELQNEGLYVDLPAWGFHFLAAERGNNGR
ncbi:MULTISPECIES: alpha-amylase family glycosyl hydrolase [Methylomicrobium]|uniref:Glycosidase n=1 Tax=Methylomicrobium album BG8 TaxID=686340 RepID=H8GMS7_METAL|nr:MULTISPECIES: alpha-amylase family glycosyl hydrolase [Methylomicrobium]EIC29479.1 glycosidase [Methylomicrobium album BG8]